MANIRRLRLDATCDCKTASFGGRPGLRVDAGGCHRSAKHATASITTKVRSATTPFLIRCLSKDGKRITDAASWRDQASK